ncbi:hypothetical protein GGI12_001672 [Dipsacomyces acuminosporus]|nr:hypothetical protein GGI12_001672 [Dipsacomyces acuminosporus]
MEDEFKRTVSPQVVELSCLDMPISMCNIPLVFVYENSEGEGDFMSSVLMKHSFYKALQQFPFLAGHLTDEGCGRANIAVDKDNLNMPIYKESTSETHYSELKDANFSWDKWPKGLALNEVTISVWAMDQIKLLAVNIVRLRANSGLALFLSVPHCVMDGYGYYAFINRWAAMCKDMRKGNEVPLSSYPQFSYDRRILSKPILGERAPLDRATDRVYTHFNLFARILAWIPQIARIRLANMASIFGSLEAHMFYISQASLDRLSDSVKRCVPEETHVSHNDIVTAVLCKLIYQCEAQVQKQNGLLGMLAPVYTYFCEKLLSAGQTAADESHQIAGMLCDIRHRIGIENKNYVGNGVMSCFIANSVKSLEAPLTEETVAEVALNVRNLVNKLDSGYYSTFMDTVAATPSHFTQFLACTMNHPTAYFSSHARFKMYDADFGSGVQAWVSMVPSCCMNSVIVFQCPPHMPGGINVFVTTRTNTMNSMLGNRYWMSLAELLY